MGFVLASLPDRVKKPARNTVFEAKKWPTFLYLFQMLTGHKCNLTPQIWQKSGGSCDQ